MVAYLWEEMWQIHASELCYNEAQGLIYYWKTWENPKQPKPYPQEMKHQVFVGPVEVS